jgi:hypothetical protein
MVAEFVQLLHYRRVAGAQGGGLVSIIGAGVVEAVNVVDNGISRWRLLAVGGNVAEP